MPSLPHVFISIIIPVYNGGDAFKACLQSLKTHLPAVDDLSTEVIVVADGCTDGSDQQAEKFGATVLRTASPGGPARARNLGAQRAKGELLFFIDADVTIHADTIPQVASLFKSDEKLAAAIGSYDDSPGAANFLSQYKNLFHHYTHQTGRAEASTFWGACGIIRHKAFKAVGGFDERYRKPSIEDIELGYRLKRKGYSIRLCKDIHVKHLKRWEPISLLRAEFFYRALPWTELLIRQQQMMVNDLNIKVSSRISIILVFAFLIISILSFFWPQALILSGLIAIGLLVINRSLYQFFYQKRGLWFMVQVIPWHWLYFGYCGLAYFYGSVRHYAGFKPASI
ncbi:MAG: glycosyltransferase [Nodosilinea sp.]